MASAFRTFCFVLRNGVLSRCILVVLLISPVVHGKEGWKILDKAKSMGCHAFGLECCRPPYFKSVEAVKDLNRILKHGFFGQHIVVQTVVGALDAHLRDENPGKALVFSFHGWAGSGKTYLSELIAKALYEKGVSSNFVRFYMASLHFPDPVQVTKYQDKVRAEIKETLGNCEHAIFVFDEVDKTPPGVFDAVMPFIDYPGKIDGLEHKKAIFIFLSNTGSNDITHITHEAWKSGRRREELTFKDFEDYLRLESFNKKESGLYQSSLIDRVLVDYFVPFLPMEREHIIKCAKVEAKRLGGSEDSVDVESIADGLTYWPADSKLYSQSGCKKVEAAVKMQLSRRRYEEDDDLNDNEINEKDEL